MRPAGRRTNRIGPFSVGSRRVVIRTNSAEFATAAAAVFADLRSPPAAADETPVEFRVDHHRLPALRWAVHRDGVPCELHLREDAVLLHLQWELNRMLIEEHPTALHAATVQLAGRGLLIAGRSHAGKTTLAACLARRPGFTYVADEVSVVGGDGQIIPYPRPLGVRPDGPLAPHLPAPDELTRRFLPSERLVPAGALGCSIGGATPVALIVVPARAVDSPLRFEPLSQAEALFHLASLAPGVARRGSEVFTTLGHLVRGASAVRLHYSEAGDTLDVLTSTVLELVASVPTDSGSAAELDGADDAG